MTLNRDGGWASGLAGTPAMPDPVTLTCTECGRQYTCDRESQAASDHTCPKCWIASH